VRIAGRDPIRVIITGIQSRVQESRKGVGGLAGNPSRNGNKKWLTKNLFEPYGVELKIGTETPDQIPDN
jgi:hypothetical protein